MKPIRVLLADDHTLIRAGISALLERIEGVEVVGEAADGRHALEQVQKLIPDVVLLNLQMPGQSGFDVLRETTERFPQVKIVVLSVYDTEDYALRALRLGAAAYLPKSAASAELELAINQVMRGEQYISPITGQMAATESIKRGTARAAPAELTPRQREVLTLIAEGYSTKDVARTLKISVKTVETHRAQLMERLGIHDIASLVRYAIRTGIVKLDD